MKKILVVIIVICVIIIVISKTNNKIQYTNHRKTVGETIIYYGKTDSAYILCGVVKQVYKKYNYVYKDSFYHWDQTLDINHDKYWWTNEYGDTTHITYTDYTDFPDDYEFN